MKVYRLKVNLNFDLTDNRENGNNRQDFKRNN